MKDHPVDPGASWLELSREAFAQNIAFLARGAADPTRPAPRLGVVLKGNAYGHGLEAMGSLVKDESVIDVVYVISLAEAQSVQRAGVGCRIVILGAYPADLVGAAAGAHGHPFEWVVSSFYQLRLWREWAPRLRAAGVADRIKVHVHVDTGLGREGFLPGEVVRAAQALRALDCLQVVGVMTHFANTEDVTHQDYAMTQINQFEVAVRDLEVGLAADGAQPPLERHMAATAAALLLPRARADVVRLGIGIYGLWPSDTARLSYRMRAGETGQAGLAPVLSWRVMSQCVKTLDQGSYVGYGCTFRCERRTRIAVFPVGYCDGFSRLLTSRAYVLVEGVRCPLIGRVMMNHIVVDVTGCRGDAREPLVATLIGQDAGQCVTAEDHARWSDTINYEVVTRIAAHLDRRIVSGAPEQRSIRGSEACKQEIFGTPSQRN
jgi:alanine racemase